jgi:hypothetical protein
VKLSDLRGEYDAIFSLGDLCLASIQLEKYNLRPYAGVLDWMASYNLSDVNRLLANRFAGFMNYPNLKVVGNASDKLYLVLEQQYNFLSNHDFFTANNFPPHLAAYPEIKAKYDRRVARFLEKMETADHILFIRTEGTYEQARELEMVLSKLVKKDFKVLLIQHDPNVVALMENNWPLRRICSIQLPGQDKWEGNHHYWEQILSGIQLRTS